LNGSAGRTERGLEVNALSWVDVTANTAYTIGAEMTPPGAGAASSTETPATPETVPAKAPSRRKKTKTKTDPKAKDDDSRVDAYLAHLNRVIPQHELTHLRYLTADGYFK
jgi:hypothetical protein